MWYVYVNLHCLVTKDVHGSAPYDTCELRAMFRKWTYVLMVIIRVFSHISTMLKKKSSKSSSLLINFNCLSCPHIHTPILQYFLLNHTPLCRVRIRSDLKPLIQCNLDYQVMLFNDIHYDVR